MSVVIGNAFITHHADPFETMRDLRPLLDRMFLERFDEILRRYQSLPAGSSWSSLPCYFMDDDEPLPSGGLSLASRLYDRVQGLHDRRERMLTDADIMYDVTLIENGRVGGGILGMLFTGDSSYLEPLLSSALADEYGYWDNADRPAGVDGAAWAERRRSWSALIDGDLSPAAAGLSFSNPGRTDTILPALRRLRSYGKQTLDV
jgi:hypothetical protein